MIKILELDIDHTISLFKKVKNKLEKGQCYNNTLKLITECLLSQFHVNIVKIGYCYVGGDNQQLLRHCVIITHDNKIIDISSTLVYNKNNLKEAIDKDNVKYYIFAELNCDEYSELLEDENYNPDLLNGLKEHEKDMVAYILKNKLEVNTYDFDKYLLPLIKEMKNYELLK